jgi:integrase
MTYEKRADADGWLADERRHLERDSRGVAPWTPPGDRHAQRWERGETLAVYGQRWITERPLKATSRKLYAGKFAHHIVPVLGDTAVKALTPDRVRSWWAGLDSAYPRNNAQCYNLLRAMCGTAVKDGVLTANPCQVERTAAPRKREPVILEVSELAALAASDKMADRYRMLVSLAAWCGLRWGEVIELRRRDVGPGCEMLSVARAVTHRGECAISTPKSGKSRNVVVPPHIRAALKHHLDTHVKPDDEALLFTAARGKCGHLDDTWFARRYYKPALAAIGREGVHLHDLRHFAGTMTARVGGTMAETMRRLGHSTVSSAMAYQAATDPRDVEIATALSRLAEGA